MTGVWLCLQTSATPHLTKISWTLITLRINCLASLQSRLSWADRRLLWFRNRGKRSSRNRGLCTPMCRHPQLINYLASEMCANWATNSTTMTVARVSTNQTWMRVASSLQSLLTRMEWRVVLKKPSKCTCRQEWALQPARRILKWWTWRRFTNVLTDSAKAAKFCLTSISHHESIIIKSLILIYLSHNAPTAGSCAVSIMIRLDEFLRIFLTGCIGERSFYWGSLILFTNRCFSISFFYIWFFSDSCFLSSSLVYFNRLKISLLLWS